MVSLRADGLMVVVVVVVRSFLLLLLSCFLCVLFAREPKLELANGFDLCFTRAFCACFFAREPKLSRSLFRLDPLPLDGTCHQPLGFILHSGGSRSSIEQAGRSKRCGYFSTHTNVQTLQAPGGAGLTVEFSLASHICFAHLS